MRAKFQSGNVIGPARNLTLFAITLSLVSKWTLFLQILFLGCNKGENTLDVVPHDTLCAVLPKPYRVDCRFIALVTPTTAVSHSKLFHIAQTSQVILVYKKTHRGSCKSRKLLRGS